MCPNAGATEANANYSDNTRPAHVGCRWCRRKVPNGTDVTTLASKATVAPGKRNVNLFGFRVGLGTRRQRRGRREGGWRSGGGGRRGKERGGC